MRLEGVKVGFQTGLDMMNQGNSAGIRLMNEPVEFTPLIAENESTFTFMDLVQQMAGESNIEFLPMKKRHENGRELYKLGSRQVYIDDHVIFMKTGSAGYVKWEAVNVDDAIDMALGLL